jgi:anti-sigma factor RsiW
MRCDETDALIDAFVEDAVDHPTRRAVEEHLAACGSCRIAVDASRALSRRLATIPPAVPSPSVDARVLAAVAEEIAWARRRAAIRRAVAATIVAAAAGGALLVGPLAAWTRSMVAGAAGDVGAWLGSSVVPAVLAARGTIGAVVAAAAVVVAIETSLARRRLAAR